MRKTYCDHCGKEIKDIAVPVKIEMGVDAHLEWHEVCKDCLNGFIILTNHFFEETRRAKK